MPQNSANNFNFDFKNAADTIEVGMSVGEIVEALRTSGEFFIHFFLGDHLEHAVPQFHLDCWQYLTSPDIPKFALALPRAHAKTTLAKLATVWYLLFTPNRFVVYVSNTHTIAMEACRDIIGYMTSLNFQQVFGQLQFDVEQDARGYYKFTLGYYDDMGILRQKYCILKAFGAGQQVRGLNIDNKRPELAVVDDLESDENTNTDQQIMDLRRWFYGPFYKALAHKAKLLYLGNMLSQQSLLYYFCEKLVDWFSMRFGAIKSDGTPLWPDMFTLDKLRQEFVEYQQMGLSGKWFAEMMNMPIAEGNLLIDTQDIYYVPAIMPSQADYTFITVDSAISQKEHADDTAIVVHAFANGLWRVVKYEVGKFTPDQIFWQLVELCHEWHTRTVGFQQSAFEQVFKYLFEILMVVNQQHFDICPLPHSRITKYEHINAWCSMMRRKQWALFEGDYQATEQLLMFDPAKTNNRDDLIDAIAMGVTMVDMYMPAIMDSYAISDVQYRVRTGYAVSPL